MFSEARNLIMALVWGFYASRADFAVLDMTFFPNDRMYHRLAQQHLYKMGIQLLASSLPLPPKRKDNKKLLCL